MNYLVAFSTPFIDQTVWQSIYFSFYEDAMNFANSFMRVTGPAFVRVYRAVDGEGYTYVEYEQAKDE